MHIEGDDATEGLAPLLAFHLLRIVQEALANVRKHAQAHKARISFSKRGDTFEMVVADDGRGFEPEALPVAGARKSFGLASMRERVASLNGELTVESRPGAGTRVAPAAGGNRRGSLAPAAG